MKREESVGAGCLAVLLMFALTPFAMVWRGCVLAKLWGWFLVPHFGVKPISWALAIGIALLLGSLHPTPVNERKKDPDTTLATLFLLWLLAAAGGPALALLMGWLIKGFI